MEALSDEVVLEVARRLPAAADLCSLSQTCRRLRALCADDSLWRSLALARWPKFVATDLAIPVHGLEYYALMALPLGRQQPTWLRVFARRSTCERAVRDKSSPAEKKDCAGYIDVGNNAFRKAREVAAAPEPDAGLVADMWATACDNYESAVCVAAAGGSGSGGAVGPQDAGAHDASVSMRNWGVCLHELSLLHAFHAPQAAALVALSYRVLDRACVLNPSSESPPLAWARVLRHQGTDELRFGTKEAAHMFFHESNAKCAETRRAHGDSVEVLLTQASNLQSIFKTPLQGTQWPDVERSIVECEEVLTRAANLNNSSVEAVQNLAWTYSQHGELLLEAGGDITRADELYTTSSEFYQRTYALSPKAETLDQWGNVFFELAKLHTDEEHIATTYLRRAIDKYDEAMRLEPNYKSCLCSRGICYLWLAKLSILSSAMSVSGGGSRAARDYGKEAKKMFASLGVDHIRTYNMACLYSVLGKQAKCEEWLRKCCACNGLSAGLLDQDTDFDSVRDSQWFQALREELLHTNCKVPESGFRLHVFEGRHVKHNPAP
eukprot:m51a1_g6895 hypothetical protein (551) ;mRNA; f:13584-15859